MSRAATLHWTRWLHLAVLAVALVYATFAHAGTELSQLRLSAGDATTRAELRLTNPPGDYKVFSLRNPDRLVLDLPATTLAAGFRAPAPNGRVIGVRTGVPQPGKLRIVFDLAGTVRPRTHVEGQGAEARLVLEMFRGDEPSPVPAASSTAPSAARPGSEPASAPVAASGPVGRRELIIAIDAGHGGRDPGAIGGGGTFEKTVTLQVARKLAEEIDRHPGMRALMIRDSDVFIPLGRRYQKAREAQADLFISLHADAAHNRQARGASVFVLSTSGASSEAARFLADRENNADLVGGVSLEDKDNNLAAILLDLSQSATLRVSDEAAGHVLDELRSVGKTHKPQVERANFWVLRSPDVPSMLVETGFITNAEDERKLNDPAFRRRIAEVIARGVGDFFGSQPPPGTWFAANPSRGSRQHLVARGETLGLIAARHGVSVNQLRSANDKRNDVVRVGERLRIPAAPE